jgi:hypothetical protein
MGNRGSQVSYQAPPPDNTFANFLQYQREKESAIEARAAQERAEKARAAEARKQAAQTAYGGLKTGIESQLRQGLISYSDATSQLRDYAAKYELTPPEQDVSSLTKLYTEQLLPGQRATNIGFAYEDVLGRAATKEEQAKALKRLQAGSTVQDLRDALTKSAEYKEKFNQSYLDNYYDTQFGKQTLDEKGKKTGKRTFTFDKSLLPTYSAEAAKTAGITTPTFKDSFTGTAAEIEEQLQNIRDTRKYLYSAGLTNLQGEIDKEVQKLKTEGTKEVEKIKQASGIYQQLVGAFNF